MGFASIEKYGSHHQWDLHTGKDPAEIIEKLAEEGNFDFCIIDTAHVHPVESLNFLTVFPFLTENCIVILHDIGLYAIKTNVELSYEVPLSSFPNCSFATKLLYDTMVGDKVTLPVSEYSGIPYRPFSNIGACQLNHGSKKYIGDVLSMLEFPWGLLPYTIELVLELVKKYYNHEQYLMLLSATTANARLYGNRFMHYARLETNPQKYDKKKIIFYGCGDHMKKILPCQVWTFTDNVSEIWDKNAENLDRIPFEEKGYTVTTPDFFCSEKEDILLVITLAPESEDIINEIKKELEYHGFSSVLHLNELKQVQYLENRYFQEE